MNTTNTNTTNDIRMDLPEESAEALIRSLKRVARLVAGVEIGVRHEVIRLRHTSLSNFIITLPEGLTDAVTEEEWAELDYELREVCGLFDYANPPQWPRG